MITGRALMPTEIETMIKVTMIRHAPDMFADSYAGDVRLVRTAGKRWKLWRRRPGNEWTAESRAGTLRVLLPVANAACPYAYSRVVSAQCLPSPFSFESPRSSRLAGRLSPLPLEFEQMDFSTLASASFLSREDRRSYLKAMSADAKRYGPDGRTPIGKRATVNGQAVVMTRDGWRRA